MKNLITSLFLFVILTLVNISAFSQGGTLDQSFGTGGTVYVYPAPGYGLIASVALQVDGKIVAACTCQKGLNITFVLIMRFNSNGSLDGTFGNGGMDSIAVGSGFDDQTSAVAIQSDGKILVSGSIKSSTNYDFFVLRVNSNGSLDNTFGTNGIAIKDLGNNEYGYCMALQSDGKILVAGSSFNGTDEDFAVLRFSTNGTLDNTFGSSGKVIIPMGTNYTDVVTSVKVQTDGKIVLGGCSTNSFATGISPSFVRLNVNGSLDITFGGSGKIITGLLPQYAGQLQVSIAIQPDGKIIAATHQYNLGKIDLYVLRYTALGVLDNTFGSGGVVYNRFGACSQWCAAVGLQTDGKILVAGMADTTGSFNVVLTRFTTSGMLDNTFGTGGQLVNLNSHRYTTCMVIQPNGKIILGTGSGGYYMLRYNGDGPVPIDAGVSNLTVPVSKCGVIGTNQTASVTVTNVGDSSISSGAISVNLVVSGANTGSYNASNSSIINSTGSTILTYNTLNLPNIGNNVFTATLTLTGDLNNSNNSIINRDTAYGLKPIVSFTSTNGSNNYSFTPIVTGKPPFSYKWNFGDGTAISTLSNPLHHYPYKNTYNVKLIATDACGTDSSTNVITITTGVNNPGTDFTFSTYPNPASDFITIKYSSKVLHERIVLYDLVGNVIKEIEIKNAAETLLDVSQLNDGIYLLSINNFVQKFFVKHVN